MTRHDILDKAAECVCGDRDHQYGTPEDSFSVIATFWNTYLQSRFSKNPGALNPKDVAAMMSLLKIARISGGIQKADSWIDLAGYAACGGEIATVHEENHAGYETVNNIEETVKNEPNENELSNDI